MRILCTLLIFFIAFKGNCSLNSKLLPPAWDGNIKSGTETITCPGPVNFYDDGGSGSVYTASKDYTLTVTASTAGQCLTVSFTSFNTESCCDNLKIYDGVGTGTLLGTYAGTTLPPNTTSTSGSLTFVFHSDGSVQNAGWVGTIACSSCAPPPPPSTNMNNTNVSLACPTSLLFYDSGGSGSTYSASESFTKTFSASAGSCVSYTFSAFNTESGYDYLSVYDGPSTASPLIGIYAGTSLPPSYTASGTSLTFKFTSDGSGQYAGWTATVSCANACSGSPNAGTAVASPSTQCGPFTTTLSLTGATSGCGITYQWYHANSVGGPFTSIGAASSSLTQTFAVSGTKYFRCVALCGALTSTTSVITASINPNTVGTGSYPVTLPYTVAGQTTCGFINDITSTNVANVCGSTSYYGGEDVVYIFTPTVTAVLNASVTSSGTYMGMNLYQGCPLSSGVCVSNAQSSAGNQSLGCASTVSAGITYYLMLDSYPTPTCNPYSLTMSLDVCTSTPASGTAIASPSVNCGPFTTTLSLTGQGVGCSVNYQWYHSNLSGGTYTAIGAASSASTQTFAITGTKYFKCVVKCGAFTSTTSVITVTINPNSIGTGSYPISVPYSANGQTTCGFINDITSANVTNVCGSTSYYTGEDVVYVFTPTVTSAFTASVTSSGSYMGLTLYQGCPTSSGTCVSYTQSSSGNQSLSSTAGCASSAITVTAGVTYYLVLDSYANPICNPYNLAITTPALTGTTTVPCNMAYTASSTTYSFETFTGTTLPTTDDVLYNTYISFGFPVCYDGASYSGGYVASNSAFVFDAVPCFPNISSTTYAAGGVSTGYSITGPAPINGTSVPRNAILAPWHDIHPGLGGTIRYITTGTAPNRKTVISFENVPMYSCGTSSPSIYHSSQIKLFETSNDIEIHVKQKRVCPGWNNGGAILGLQNYNGTIYVPPVNATAHNVNAALTYTWNMTNTAYKFVSSCIGGGVCGVILPIGLKHFYGERVDKVNNLYWETATEKDINYYSVERSNDGVEFNEIGQVAANNLPSKYHFEDRNTIPGMIHYYRVIVKELDGTQSSTQIIALSSGNDEMLTVSELFPNPAAKSFMIGLDSKQKGQATINVYDVFGKVLSSSEYDVNGGVNQYTISVEDFAAGVYYVEVLNSFNEIITKQKLVKE